MSGSFRLFPIEECDDEDWGCPTWAPRDPSPQELYELRIKARGHVVMSEHDIQQMKRAFAQRNSERTPDIGDFDLSG